MKTEAREDFESLSHAIARELQPVGQVKTERRISDSRADFESTSIHLVGKAPREKSEFIPKRG